MKSVSELLNLLAATPSDGTFLKGGPVSGKSSQSNGNSFGDILTQLANQQDNSGANQPKSDAAQTATPGGVNPSPTTASTGPSNNTSAAPSAPVQTSSIVDLSETVISVSESIQVSSSSQLAQAEQSLTTLAAGLSKLLNLFSSLQNMDTQQAQNAIVSLGGGQITPADAMGLLNAIQQITQKDPGQNPLLMTPDQQNNLLNQAFQQMFQGQQLALGTFNNQLSAANPTSTNSVQINNVILQMTFSDTNVTAIQQTGAQASRVFIDLQNFQMSATFVQAGAGLATGQGNAQPSLPTFQSLPSAMADPLLASFNQALLNLAGQNSTGSSASPTLSSAQGSAPSQNSTSQTFQNLVQLLVQSGASQAVLTSYLNQTNTPITSGADQSQVQNTALDNFLNSVTLLSQNPSLGPAFAAAQQSALVPGNGAQEPGAGAGTLSLVAENITQTSILMDAQAVLVQPQTNDDRTQGVSQATNIQVAAISMSVFDVQGQGAVAPPLDLGTLNNLNDSVARLNIAAAQVGQTPVNNQPLQVITVTVDQILANLEAIQSSPINLSSVSQGSGNVGASLVNSPSLSTGNQNVEAPSQTPHAVLAAANDQTGIGPNPQTIDPNLNVDSFSVATGATTTSTTGTDASAVNPQQAPLSTGASFDSAISGGGVVQIAVRETILPNGANVQDRISNGVSAPDQATNNPGTGVLATVTTQVPSTTNVPASVFAGETVKNSVQPQTPENNNNNETSVPPIVLSGQPGSEVKSITPSAVLAVSNTSQGNVGFNLTVNPKSVSDDPLVQMNSNLLNSGLLGASDKGQGVNVPVNSQMTNVTNGSINSAQILNQIADQIAAQAADARAVSRLSFQLVPESLGKVTIQIALVDQSVSARIFVSNPDVRDAIQHHMVDLKAALNQSGLQIDQLQVQVQGGGANLLAQYYQYQQEGSGYRLPVGSEGANVTDANSLESTGDLANLSVRLSLVNVLA